MSYTYLQQELTKLNVFTAKGNINNQSWRILQNQPQLSSDIKDATSFLTVDTELRTRLFCIKNNVFSEPSCKVCGKPMAFNKQKNQFNTYCPNTSGQSCAAGDFDLVNKRKATLVANYGEEGFLNPDIVGKRKATLVERYGVDVPMKSASIRAKASNTIMEKYGVTTAAHIPGVAEKREATNILKYGSTTYAGGQVPKESLDLLSDSDWLESRLKDFTLSEIADELEISTYTVRKYVHDHGLHELSNTKLSSSMHRQFMRVLDQHNVKYISNHKQLIAPKEVDLYIPSANLAIEFDGVFYHSELSGRSKSYHRDKTISCNNAGARLIHVWSTEWNNQPDIVTSRILNAIGIGIESVFARKCEIVRLTPDQEKSFFNTHHIQGYRASSVCYGLKYNGAIVAAESFIKSRFNKDVEWELLRYANAKNTRVVGGASKLFKEFIRNYTPSTVISYCDARWGTGSLYTSLGFVYQHTSSPNYFYFKRNGDTNKLMSRQNFQKHKLSKLLDHFDPALSEWDNMKANGYDRIWDCGNMVFLWAAS